MLRLLSTTFAKRQSVIEQGACIKSPFSTVVGCHRSKFKFGFSQVSGDQSEGISAVYVRVQNIILDIKNIFDIRVIVRIMIIALLLCFDNRLLLYYVDSTEWNTTLFS